MYISKHREETLGAPSARSDWCIVCGRQATNQHHVVPGYRKPTRCHPESPTVSLCGMGNASGCHGKAHQGRLHFRYRDGWEYLETEEAVREDEALGMEGWRRCRT